MYRLLIFGVAVLDGEASNPTDIVISPDGTTAYVTCSGGGVDVLKTVTNTVSATIVASGASGEAITPDGQTVHLADTAADEVIPITTTTNAVDAPITLSSTIFDPAPLEVVVTPDGSSACVASSNAVWPIDLATATVGSPISASAALTSGGTASSAASGSPSTELCSNPPPGSANLSCAFSPASGSGGTPARRDSRRTSRAWPGARSGSADGRTRGCPATRSSW